MNSNVESAIIGSIFAGGFIILKDWGLAIWQSNRSDAKDSLSVFHLYADPLAASSASLLWRLNEVFRPEGRGVYLRADSPKTDYCLYKRLSTEYRIASLIAWVRAIKREQSFIPLRYKRSNGDVERAIDSLEDALAQGDDIEWKRLQFLCELWQVPIPLEQDRKRIAASLDHCVQHCRATFASIDGKLTSSAEQHAIARNLAQCLITNTPGMSLNDLNLNENVAQAYGCYSIKEAWLYRDWQAGIGDMMLVEVAGRPRRFDVISYGDFENLPAQGTDEQKLWTSRLAGLIDDIDIFDTDSHRTKQLRNCYISAAKIVCSIDSVLRPKSVFKPETLALARKVATTA